MRRISRLAILGLAGLAVAGVLTGSPTSAAGTVGFGAPIFVDRVRAGGEPGILHSNKFGNLVYTSHEGTTHIDREGGPASVQGAWSRASGGGWCGGDGVCWDCCGGTQDACGGVRRCAAGS